MSVEQRLMQVGRWDIQLVEETPQSVLDVLDPFGHVVILPAAVEPSSFTDATLLAQARLSGVVYHIDHRQLSGPTATGWLGDSDGKGLIFEQTRTGASATYTDESFRAWVDDIMGTPDPNLTLGTLTSVAGALTHRMKWVNQKQALDYVMEYFGGEYRVNPDFTIDAGTEADLFVTSPQAMIIPSSFGDDPNAVGLEPDELARERDVEDYTTDVIVLGRGQGEETIRQGVDRLTDGEIPYTNPQGHKVTMQRIVSSDDVDSDAAGNTLAAQQLGRFDDLRKSVRLSASRYDITGDVRPGDSVWVFDPQNGLFDLNNQVQFRGETVHPEKRRVYAINWPIEAGMSVYFRAGDGTYMDLTEWVEYESGAAQFEVGASRRTLTGTEGGPSARLETRAGGGVVWVDYTPAWTAATTNPAVGNGTLAGRYTRFGDLVMCAVYLQPGSTTTFGSGDYAISLPVDAASDTGGRQGLHLTQPAFLRDADLNTAPTHDFRVNLDTASTVKLTRSTGASPLTWSDSQPFTFAESDQMRFFYVYEAA